MSHCRWHRGIDKLGFNNTIQQIQLVNYIGNPVSSWSRTPTQAAELQDTAIALASTNTPQNAQPSYTFQFDVFRTLLIGSGLALLAAVYIAGFVPVGAVIISGLVVAGGYGLFSRRGPESDDVVKSGQQLRII